MVLFLQESSPERTFSRSWNTAETTRSLCQVNHFNSRLFFLQLTLCSLSCLTRYFQPSTVLQAQRSTQYSRLLEILTLLLLSSSQTEGQHSWLVKGSRTLTKKRRSSVLLPELSTWGWWRSTIMFQLCFTPTIAPRSCSLGLMVCWKQMKSISRSFILFFISFSLKWSEIFREGNFSFFEKIFNLKLS